MVTRFAPSPTGLLHTGHAFAAKVACDLARKAEGRFLLRFEDIDSTRVRKEFYEAIEQDLRWLNLDWDGTPIRQSDRLSAYHDSLETLKSKGMVYPCFCTRREIETEVASIPSAPHGPEGALYPGTCRTMSRSERDRRLGSGQLAAWRLNAGKASGHLGPMSFEDQRLGHYQVDSSILGDVVMARKDIGTSYHLAVVVDDAMQGVSLVTRGEDLLSSTHVHRVIQSLLGLPEPEYLHHPLITDDQGRRLSKRDQDQSLRGLKGSGMTPEDIFSAFPSAS